MTISDIRRNVEKQFLLQQVQTEEFGGKLQITEEEARQYYQANQKEFVEPATVTLREILIEVPTATQQGRAMVSVGKDDEAAKKADAVRARLTAGEDFAKVAAEVSASASKANGGLIGPIAMTELSPDLAEDARRDEARRHHRSRMRAAQGLPDPQAGDVEAARPCSRSTASATSSPIASTRIASRTEMRKFIERVRAPGDHRVEERGAAQGLRTAGRSDEHGQTRARGSPSATSRTDIRSMSASPAWYAIWTRSRHEQVVREQLETEGLRSLSADDRALEPLEGPQEEDRLAALSRLLLRALRRRRAAAHPEVHRRRQHRLVRRRNRADSRAGDRRHPPAGRERSAVRSVPSDSRRADGRSRRTVR